MLFFKPTQKVKRLEKRLLDLQSQIDAKDRQIEVLQAEVETLALVIARDRARVQAEMAGYVRQRAEHEGLPDERDTEGSVRFGT